MAIISRLGVLLGLDSAEFNKGLGLAQKNLGVFNASTVTSKLSIAALGASFVFAAKDAINFADKINDVAKANEVTVGTVLKLSQALAINGGNTEDAGRLLSAFANKIDEAATGGEKGQEAFKKLGISLKDIATLDQKALFEKTLGALGKIPDALTRNAMAADIFGKAVKGVDIKGLADDYTKNQDDFRKAEQAFKAIGKAMDEWSVFSVKAKTSLAENVGPALLEATRLVNDFIFGWDELEKRINKKKTGGQAGMTWKPTPTIFDELTPQAQKELLPEKYSEIIKLREVQAANAKKLAEEYKKQSEALDQNVRLLKLETDQIGRAKTEAEKLSLEFQKGGKYDRIGINSAKGQELMRAAQDKDMRNAMYFVDMEMRKAQYQQEYYLKQIEIAGMSDTQKEKQLELLRLHQEMLDLERQHPELSKSQIDAIEKERIAMINLHEAATRTANTFQAGFSNAFENFKEKATDSFAIGQQAFQNMATSMSNALDQFVETGKISFKSLIADMIKQLLKLQMQAQLSGFFSSLGGIFNFGGGGTGTSVPIDFSGFTMPSFAFADGGSPPVGVASLVGERGPELFIPNTAGTIIPNDQLGSVMGSKPSIVYNGPYIANMSAIDTQSGLQFLAKNKQGVWAANQSAQRGLPQSR